jgi:hypothetical protein
MSRRTIIDSIIEAYHKYGSVKVVSEQLNVPINLVEDSILLPRAPKEVQEAVKKGEIDLHIAIRATDALKWGTDIEGAKVLELARRIEGEKMSSVEIEAIKKEAEADPSRDIDEMIKKSRKRKIVHELTIKLLNDDIEQLKRYAKDHDLSEDEALANVVKKALTEVTESNSSK